MKYLLLLLTAVSMLPIAVALDQPPEPPHQFYGSVEYLGEPLDGHELIAKLGSDEFSTPIASGTYGYSEPFLINNLESGDDIDFYIRGHYISNYTYESAGYTQLNFTVPENVLIINTTIEDLNLFVGDNQTSLLNLTNLTGEHRIEFRESNTTRLEFDYDFDESDLDVEDVAIVASTENDSSGFIIISNLNLTSGQRKTVYMDNLDAGKNYVCIKDSDIASVAEISSGCNGPDEVRIACNGVPVKGYTCNDIGALYQISGLLHSGVIEAEAPQSQNLPSGGNRVPDVGLGGVVILPNASEEETNVPEGNGTITLPTSENETAGIQNRTEPIGGLSAITGAFVGLPGQLEKNITSLIIIILIIGGFVWRRRLLRLIKTLLRLIVLGRLRGRKRRKR